MNSPVPMEQNTRTTKNKQKKKKAQVCMLLIEQTAGVHATSITNKTKKEYKNKGTHSTKSHLKN